MTVSLQKIVAITLFVEDAQKSKEFYERVFGVPVIYEDDHSAAFKFESLVVNLLEHAPARELIDPAAVAGGGTGSSFQLTIPVDDTDAACAELAARGVTLVNGPIDRAWGLRTAAFADPDGHIWEVAADLPAAG